MSIFNVFVVGGTGAQGIQVVRGLVADGKYAVKVLTRDPDSRRAKELLELSPNVELFPGTLTSEADLREGLKGCDGAFVNIDGFTVGEKTEMFWTMRIYELAVEIGINTLCLAILTMVFERAIMIPSTERVITLRRQGKNGGVASTSALHQQRQTILPHESRHIHYWSIY